jgi:ADP-ribosylglycohydrolase
MSNAHSHMLLMIALGDAYGAGLEFIERSPKIMDNHISKALEFTQYLQHPFHSDLKPGCYTDDAEMSVANARVLLENNYPFTKLQFAQAYLREFNRGGKRKGYAGGFYKFLSSIDSGQEFVDKIVANSDKNGAAMRSVPFGVMKNITEMLAATTIQASLTHNTPAGLFSARAVALMSYYALHTNDSFGDIVEFMRAYVSAEDWHEYGHIFLEPWDGGLVSDRPNCPISVTTVHAVVDLLRRHSCLMDIMRQLILWKGDTDSVAAIAWGIASARSQKEKLPDFLYQNLELGSEKTGVKYLVEIGEGLMSKYGKK